ncbi:flagellar hook-associated protein FlgK [Ruegeria pomeroyi]|nr:flagellar hook-associated protein FlgK [Ruegeria pomeroyi]
MTISAALHSALSGLTAASRATGVTTDNIANALTPGYARRSLEVTGNTNGGTGVRIVGVTRHADPVLVANRRGADAARGYADTVSDFQNRLLQLVGGTDDPRSVPNLIAEFESSLIAAASNPSAQTRLDAAATAASDLTAALNFASDGLRDARNDADRSIGQQVDRLNTVLQNIETLNGRIQSVKLSGGDTASLLDQRQEMIDEVNTMVPVNVVTRDHGSVALFTDGGAILLDGPAAQLSFSPTTQTMPHMTLDNGMLSGLELNGTHLRISGPTSAIRGGTLAAAFDIRDELSVEAQKDLDLVARDLVERFEAPALDPTAAPTDPGLFTDNGARFAATAQTGLAGRLELNTIVDPKQGGLSWRLRDGLGAVAPGAPGNATQINAFLKALTVARTPLDTRFGTGAITASGVGTALLSRVTQNDSLAAERLAFASASQTEMQKLEMEQGVDTDSELQTLMQLEQAFAANARVIETVGEMMDTLLRL